MTKKHLAELLAEKAAIERGELRPARVVQVERTEAMPRINRRQNDDRTYTSVAPPSQYRRKELKPAAIQRHFKKEWVAQARARLGLSQSEFARLLGISVRTLQQWEQGRSRPNGAARVLLRVAAANPKAVLEAA